MGVVSGSWNDSFFYDTSGNALIIAHFPFKYTALVYLKPNHIKKMLKTAGTIFCLLLVLTASPQSKADTLLQSHTSATSTDSVHALFTIAKQYRDSLPELSLAYAKKALKLATGQNKIEEQASIHQYLGLYYKDHYQFENANDHYKFALQKSDTSSKIFREVLYLRGSLYMTQQRLDSAEVWISQAADLCRQASDSATLAKTVNVLGCIYDLKGKTIEGIEKVTEASMIATLLGDSVTMANAAGNLGLLFSNIGIYDSALAYHIVSLAIDEEMEEKNAIALTLLNIANIYADMGELEKAIEKYKETATLTKSIKRYEVVAKAFSNMADCYNLQHKHTLSIRTGHKALQFATLAKSMTIEAATCINMAEGFIGLAQYDSAFIYNERALKIFRLHKIEGHLKGYSILVKAKIEKAKGQPLQAINTAKAALATQHLPLSLSKDIYELLYSTLESRGDIKQAFTYYKGFIAYRDSLMRNDRIRNVGEIEAKYHLEKKNAQTKILLQQKQLQQKDIEIKNAQLKTQSYIIGFSAFLLIAFIIRLLFLAKAINEKKSQNEMLKQLNHRILTQQADVVKVSESLKKRNMEQEKEIQEKSAQILKQHHQLTNYLFTNSHEVRAPLARLLSLVQLIKIEKEIDIRETVDHLDQASQELDVVIKNIHSELET